MIVVNTPTVYDDIDEVVISSRVLINDNEEILWYRFPLAYKEYLVTERVDAFVVGILFLALRTGNDIKVEGVISSRLYYTLNHYLINALCLANPELKKIQLHARQRDHKNLNVHNVAGTGFSCGVDSFATYYDHINEIAPYKIEYFTFFNVGSHGDFGGEKAREVFYRRFERIQEFATKVGKEVIRVDSNLSDILKENFQKSHTLRSVSCILLLQKLFRNFYYASSVKFDHFKLDRVRIAEYDLLNLQMLSTESTNLYSSVAQYSRIEKIKLIAENVETHNFLDVCTSPKPKNLKINCSECNKCLRTMLSLEILGYLEEYSEVFDIEKFYKIRSRYLGTLLWSKNKETLDIQTLKLMKDNSIKIPFASYFYGLKKVLYTQKRLLKKNKK